MFDPTRDDMWAGLIVLFVGLLLTVSVWTLQVLYDLTVLEALGATFGGFVVLVVGYTALMFTIIYGIAGIGRLGRILGGRVQAWRERTE